MIYLKLFLAFLKVGCFSFGGAYSAIPLIRDVVLSNGWMSEEELTYMIAVSESTPGPIMVNLASYVGISQAGILGGVVATLTVVFPAFLIILLVTNLLKTVLDKPLVQAVLQGLAPCVVGIIASIGLYMVLENTFLTSGLDVRALVITGILVGAIIAWKKIFHKKLSAIMLIVISAALGIVVYGI